jgi:hypothetical protein
MNIPDGSTELYFTPNVDRRFVSYGWLGTAVNLTGETAPEVVSALRILADANECYCDCLGEHTCEICNAFSDRSSFYIDLDDSVRTAALLPRMVLHYICDHHYKLPSTIESAALRSISLLPPPVADYRTDNYVRSLGYEPLKIDGQTVVVRSIAPKCSYSVEELEWILDRPIIVDNA